jgi:CrcB protein
MAAWVRADGRARMLNMLAVALGAAIGANLRYGLATWAAQRLGTNWPYGTFIINVLGCLLIGGLLTLVATRLSLSEPVRLLLVTGLLGGFTTFSTFGYESFTLITTGNWLGAALYIGASIVVGLLAVFLGAGLVRLITG